MNYKNKGIIVTILALILIFGFSYWFFSLRLNTENTENKTSQTEQLTDEQKLDILSKTSNTPNVTIPDAEKLEILNKINTNIQPTNLSDEEKLQILSGTN